MTETLVELAGATGGWVPLPFRFDRLDDRRVVLTNLVGEHAVVSPNTLDTLMRHGHLPLAAHRLLRSKLIIRDPEDELPIELLAMRAATRMRHLSQLTSLHIFVVSLRCEHACHYCQVSRQSSSREEFDMTPETAQKALEIAFSTPSPGIKIEFQGGEPLLNFDLVQQIVLQAKAMNERYAKQISFVIASNLALLDESVLDFCMEHDVFLSTSLDGPQDLHNENRPRPGGDSWQRAVAGIEMTRSRLGPDYVSALMTTTERSLDRVEEIIDTYVAHDFNEIFLRPMSPYGLAMRTRAHAAYDVDRWLAFYTRGLDHIIQLNRHGTPFVERYAAIILRKLLTNDDPRYVDLTSPAGTGIGALVYNYDGSIYASDEGRMLAEMGDTTFRLGHVDTHDFASTMTSARLLDALDESFTTSSPMCADCAYETCCGSDPVYHHATTGDVVGLKPESAFCRRNMAIFRLLIDRYESDPTTHNLFWRWAHA
jgi:His-Xaa-Ser system radical SAM maturase HxsB